MDLDKREAELQARLDRLDALEQELKRREGAKKQVPLRLSNTLWTEIAAWAEEDFRSINGQIEFSLTEAVRNRKKRQQNPPPKDG